MKCSDRTRKMWPFNTGDHMDGFDCIFSTDFIKILSICKLFVYQYKTASGSPRTFPQVKKREEFRIYKTGVHINI
jgi:hypothetical protein